MYTVTVMSSIGFSNLVGMRVTKYVHDDLSNLLGPNGTDTKQPDVLEKG
jgi:hypothetical protein